MRIILALSLLLSACACVGNPLISITGGSSGGGKLDPGATNAVLEASYAYTDNASLESLQSSKTYSDTNTLVRSKSYTDFAAFSVISDLKTYANTVAASSLTSAKLYSDTNTLFRANNYTDSIGFGIESSAAATARGYCADTLSASKLYSQTNTLLEAKNFAGSQDVVVLSQARQYADNAASTKLPKSGGTMTGNIFMAGHMITGLPLFPTAEEDAASMAYVDSKSETVAYDYYSLVQGDIAAAIAGATNGVVYSDGSVEMESSLDMSSYTITNVGSPECECDAATKAYVDGSTNAVLVAAKTSADSAITSATNRLAVSSYDWSKAFRLYCFEYPGNTVPVCLHHPVTVGSTNSPISQLTCSLVTDGDALMAAEIIVDRSVAHPPILSKSIYSGSVFDFNISAPGNSSTTSIQFVLRVTYTRSSGYVFEPAKVSCVRTYYFTVYFAASPAT